MHRLARIAVLLAAILVISGPAAAQPSFTEVSPTSGLWQTGPDEDFWANAVAPADYDGDGDTDLAVLGFYVVYNQSADDRLVLMRNDGPGPDGNWVFTEVPVPLGTLTAGASDLAWGDIDGDGDPDLAVGSNGDAALYRNDGGSLVLTNTVLPGYSEDSGYTNAYDLRSLTWADVDNDGDLDLLEPSVFDSLTFSYSTKLLRNDGPNGTGGWIFTDTNASIDPAAHAQSAWADDDGDQDLDLFLATADPYVEDGFVRRFRNDNGIFTGQDLLGIQVQYGLADWGDYDADRDLDILVAGNIREGDGSYSTVLRIYRNDGNGVYTPNTLINGPTADWLDLHAATWADYDSDGDVDLLVTGNFVGQTDIEGHSQIWANTNGTFAPLDLWLPAPISSVGRGGSFTWFDIDGDGDLDYFIAGAYYVPGGNGLVDAQMHLYRNGASSSNAAPSTPLGLSAAPAGPGAVNLSWAAASDDHTASRALTYTLEVRRAGAPAAINDPLPEPGNISATTRWQLRGLPPGSYTWNVRALDSAFNAGARAESSFTIGSGSSGPPAVPDGAQGSGMSVRKLNPQGTNLAVSWDTTTCFGAVAYNLIWGYGSQLPSAPGGQFALSGSRCTITSPYAWLNSPNPTANPTRLVWFLLVATDGAATEGSWGEDNRGVERVGPAAGGASGMCGVTAKSVSNGCGH